MWRTRVSMCLVLAAVAVVSSASACANGTAPSEELADARSKWLRSAPASYAYTIRISCECTAEMAGPTVVTVRNRNVESRIYVQSGAAVSSQYAGSFPAVEGLFAMIEDAIRNGTKPFVAQYHPSLGYPTRIELGDPAVDAPMYLVSDFQAR